MHKLDEKGSLVLPLVIVSFLMIGAGVFGVWAFMGRQDYKNNTQSKIDDAVVVAKENLSREKDLQFAEEYKKPNSTYKGPSSYGSLTITYPRTWSVFANDSGRGAQLVDGFMHPGYVKADSDDINFAFRFQVMNQKYSQIVKNYDGLSRQGIVKVSGYNLPKVPDIVGSKLTGQVNNKKQGKMIILPLRNQTIKIWTEGEEFTKDFDEILKTLTFDP